VKVELVLAPNPGPFTGPGTNSWVISDGGEAVVVDPGPVIAEHLSAIEAALDHLEPVAVIVTHTHPDHAPAANGLALHFGVPSIGAAPGPDFSPDRLIADGDGVGFGGVEAVCVATPGHTPDSVCYRVGDALFSGDHIMGGSTVVVEDMSDYIASLQKLRNTGLRTIYPGHGPVIEDPESVLAEYVAHRLERERQILGALERGAATVGAIVEDVYADVDPSLHPAAAMSVGAHLIKLRGEGRVEVSADPNWDSEVVPL
jgi:glyoxylase-like metal-dependent hydrolase (beta-lactamase superfamily II)